MFDLSLNNIDSLPIAVGYKNKASEYLFCNKVLATCMGYQKSEDVFGLTDYDIKSPMSSLAEKYISQDLEAMQINKCKHIDIGYYPNGDLKIHYSIKKPFYDNQGGLSGTQFVCVELGTAFINNFYQRFLRDNTPAFYRIDATIHNYQLTRRELECLFFVIRGWTANSIAQELVISSKTVEYYIGKLKLKLSCQNRKQLIEKAIDLGFLFNLPSTLL